jgi:carbon-monoxide dehydrogenase large subunit
MTQSFGHEGQARRRADAQGRRTLSSSDWNLPGQAYGYFLRTDRPHADIVSIRTRRARMKGVIAVLTGDDVAAAGQKPMPAAAPMKGRGGPTRSCRRAIR